MFYNEIKVLNAWSTSSNYKPQIVSLKIIFNFMIFLNMASKLKIKFTLKQLSCARGVSMSLNEKKVK